MQKCPLGIRQWVLHEQISIGRLHKACQGGNLRQYVTFTYHLSWLANTCTWYVEYAYKIVSHTILCRKMRSISQRERQTHNYWQLTSKITLLAPKLLLNYLWPMITIQSHPSIPFHKAFLSPSGDLGIGLVWDNNRTGPTFWWDCWNPLQTELDHQWWVLSYSQDDTRWF